MKEFFGYGRKRDESGAVVKRFLNTYVNCLHTQVVHARENMEVLIAEFDMSEIKYVGQMSSSQNSRVIDPSGISYAVTNGHKDGEPKIIERDTPMKGNYKEPRICTMVGRDPNNPSSRVRSDHYEQFLEMGDDVSNTLTSVQKDNLVAEPQVLTPKRTDFGKQVRKQYESGELDMSRHDMTELEPRTDGVSNTLTSVQKDNLVAEPQLIEVGNLVPQTGKWKSPQRGRVFSPEGISPSMDTCSGGNREPKIIDDTYKDRDARVYDEVAPTMRSGHDTMKVSEPSYRIRKLTPRECFRLMGVSETNIDKIQQSGVSQSQQYKMAGNSIVVDCLYHLFRKMLTETHCESQQLSLF